VTKVDPGNFASFDHVLVDMNMVSEAGLGVVLYVLIQSVVSRVCRDARCCLCPCSWFTKLPDELAVQIKP